MWWSWELYALFAFNGAICFYQGMRYQRRLSERDIADVYRSARRSTPVN